MRLPLLKTLLIFIAALFMPIASHGQETEGKTAGDKTPTILFICEHGAAKSVIAAAYFDKLAKERGLKYRAVFRFAFAPPAGNTAPQEVTYHGVESVAPNIVLAANEGRSYVDAVDVSAGKLLDRLTTGVAKPCCISVTYFDDLRIEKI